MKHAVEVVTTVKVVTMTGDDVDVDVVLEDVVLEDVLEVVAGTGDGVDVSVIDVVMEDTSEVTVTATVMRHCKTSMFRGLATLQIRLQTNQGGMGNRSLA